MPLDPLKHQWEAFGWRPLEIDGHDFEQIVATVEEAWARKGQPAIIIARTVKGKGVSFMENNVVFHGTPPSEEEYARAMQELRDDR